MPVYARKNQYLGINPQLQSMLQTPGTQNDYSLWPSFHQQFLVHLADVLNTQLPPGYIAVNEHSLQILGEFESGGKITLRPAPDVSIHQRRQSHMVASSAVSAVVSQPTWESVIADTLDVEEQLPGLAIYPLGEHRHLGKPIVRIELLSPSNKPGGSNYAKYRSSRRDVLYGGTPLIEIDFLHEQESPLRTLPVYPTAPDSYPYYIALSDPRNSAETGPVQAYGSRVDSPLPVITIPLSQTQSLAFDFTPPYQHTFEIGRWGEFVDYEQLPERFETYREDDQARIKARMQAVQAAHARGLDLESGPFPLAEGA